MHQPGRKSRSGASRWPRWGSGTAPATTGTSCSRRPALSAQGRTASVRMACFSLMRHARFRGTDTSVSLSLSKSRLTIDSPQPCNWGSPARRTGAAICCTYTHINNRSPEQKGEGLPRGCPQCPSSAAAGHEHGLAATFLCNPQHRTDVNTLVKLLCSPASHADPCR